MQIDRIRADSSPALKENDFDPEDEEQRTLFCANLSENVTDEVLYELFIQSGPVESVRIPKDKDNRPRGFGFVTFVHSVTVPYAIDLYSGVRLFNRDLILRFRNSNNAGSRNQTPTGRPRNDNCNFNSRDETPRSRPSRHDDSDRRTPHHSHSPPDNNSLRAGHGGGGGGNNRFDSNMRPAQSFGQSDKQKNFQNPFNINDLSQLGAQFLFKPLEDAVATMMKGNLNDNEMSPSGKSSRSNRPHNQNNPYYNKHSQNSSRGNNSGRHGDWDRPSNQRQNQRRRR